MMEVMKGQRKRIGGKHLKRRKELIKIIAIHCYPYHQKMIKNHYQV